MAQQRHRRLRQIGRPQNSRPLGVVDIVIDVRRKIGNAHDLSLERLRALRRRHAYRRAALSFGMMSDAVPHLPREVQPLPIVLEHVDDTQALLVVVESARDEIIQHPLAGVTEWRVAEVMAESDRLC